MGSFWVEVGVKVCKTTAGSEKRETRPMLLGLLHESNSSTDYFFKKQTNYSTPNSKFPLSSYHE